jgi:plastocyanin
MNTGFRKRRRSILAATSTLAVAAGIAAVSVAGAAEDKTIYASDSGGNCFTTTPGAACGAGGPVDITIETGDKVTWDFTTGANLHNVARAPTNPSDPPDPDGWDKFKPVIYHNPGEGVDSYVFGKPGVYKYVCELHSNTMYGTITVEGEEVETPTPTPPDEDEDPDQDQDEDETPETPSVTATPTATPAPTVDDHLSTPRPGRAAKDTQAPRLLKARVKRLTTGARLRFWLSEPATVSIKLVRKRAKSPAASAVVQAPAGTHSFVLRTRALRRGTYTATFAPTDAMGNKGATAKRKLRVR